MSEKIHKNPNRENNPTVKPYTPQYQIHGIEPKKVGGSMTPQIRQQPKPTAMPYTASTPPSPIGRGALVPNVGNNMEHAWSGANREIVDDFNEFEGQEVDSNHPMIDNNEYLTDEALGNRSSDDEPKFRPPIAIDNSSVEEYASPQLSMQHQFTNEQRQEYSNLAGQNHTPISSDDIFPILADLQEDAYLLIVGGIAICSGPKEEIEEQARLMIYGEHEKCEGTPVPHDDLLIVKRVKIKVGLHLED